MSTQIAKGTPIILNQRTISPEMLKIVDNLWLDRSDFYDVTRVVGKILWHDPSFCKRMELATDQQISQETITVTSQVEEDAIILLWENDELVYDNKFGGQSELFLK